MKKGGAGGRALVRLRHLQGLWSELREVPDGPPQLDRWLAQRLRAMRQAGSSDRRCYGDLLFACMRHAYLAAFLVRTERSQGWREAAQSFLADAALPSAAWREVTAADSERLLRFGIAADLVLGRPPFLPAEEVSALQSLLARECDTVAAATSDLCGAADLELACLAFGIPSFFAAALVTRMRLTPGFDPMAFLSMQRRRSPLWLRINDLRKAKEIVTSLRQDYDVVPEGAMALRIAGPRGLNEHPVIKQGFVEIQDLASQGIGASVDAHPGHFVWDACAGGGGKTLQLAAALRGEGVVYASDIRAYKLDETRKRAARAGFSNVRPWPWDARQRATFPLEVNRRGGFDRVLVDAPCSATGTWRRNPDWRFRITPAQLSELKTTQAEILASVAAVLRNDGKLIYGTCSFLAEENEQLVESFLAKHPSFRLERMDLLGAPATDSDTMFAAVLSRQ